MLRLTAHSSNITDNYILSSATAHILHAMKGKFVLLYRPTAGKVKAGIVKEHVDGASRQKM